MEENAYQSPGPATTEQRNKDRPTGHPPRCLFPEGEAVTQARVRVSAVTHPFFSVVIFLSLF